MKHINTPIAALLAACLLLAGCNTPTESNSIDSTTSTSSTQTQSSSETSSSTPDSSSSDGSHNSVPDNSTPNAETPVCSKLTETERIFKIMKDYGDFYYDMQPGTDTELEKIADKNTKITVKGRTYPFLKLTNAPANTMTELGEKLDGLVTEKLKNEFIDSVKNDDYHYQIKDDDIYVTKECFAYGAPYGADRLYLNSIEYPDEKTVLVNMTSFGDKAKWETEKDIENKFSITLVRTDDGFRIEECDSIAVAYLEYYNEIFYGDISLSF